MSLTTDVVLAIVKSRPGKTLDEIFVLVNAAMAPYPANQPTVIQSLMMLEGKKLIRKDSVNDPKFYPLQK